ncbi:hypothetical protein [Porphyromonas pogonae]|uniref:hypothetical protein n=1 Tax=Porphyromonas pogonae TaxID=867595 RepID=UPI002E786BBF|nr:hypothetical protein [Porphyromonas pogonae]
MKKTIIPIVLALSIGLAGCSKSNDNPKPDPNPNPNPEVREKILIETSVFNPGGETGSSYIQMIPNLLPKTYDNTHAIPAGFHVSCNVVGNHVYDFPNYLGSTKSELVQYTVGDNGTLMNKKGMTLPGNSAASNVVELNGSKAYLALQSIGYVYVFDPSTMQKIGEIDLNSLKAEGANVSPGAMLIRDNYLYVGLNQMNNSWMPNEKQAEVAIIDTKTDKVVKKIIDKKHQLSFATRPIEPKSIFMDEAGDIYINCLGGFGLKPGFEGGLLRIKKGQTDFDPNYVLDLSKTDIEGLEVSGKAQFIASCCYIGNGLLAAYLNVNALEPGGNPYTAFIQAAAIIDIRTGKISRIKELAPSNPFTMAIGLYKDQVIFGSSNKKDEGLYSYTPKDGKVVGPIVRTQGTPIFFHYFGK